MRRKTSRSPSPTTNLPFLRMPSPYRFSIRASFSVNLLFVKKEGLGDYDWWICGARKRIFSVRAPFRIVEVIFWICLFVMLMCVCLCFGLLGGARLRILFDQKRCPRGLRCFAQIAEQGLNLSGS